MKKKIAFLFPGRDTSPCGGYKIAYEYANRFSQIGYDVALVYPHIETFFSQENKNIFIQNFFIISYHLKFPIFVYTNQFFLPLKPSQN